MDFYKYIDETPPLLYVQTISMNMKSSPLNNVLFPRMRRTIWDSLSISQFLCFLTSDNMNVTVVSKSFTSIAKEVEKSFGTKYKKEKILGTLILEWEVPINKLLEMKLPQPNKFLPKNFKLHSVVENEAPKEPYIIHKTSLMHIWYKQDIKFKVPQQHIWFEFIRPMERSLPSFFSMWLMYALYTDELSEDHLYHAKVANFNWELSVANYKVVIQVNGFSDTISLLLEELLSRMMNIKDNITTEKFTSLKNKIYKVVKTLTIKNITAQMTWYSTFLVEEYSWDWNAVYMSLKRMKWKNFQKFASKLFSRGFIRTLIHGNCSKQEALNIVSILEKYFQSTANLTQQEMVPPRTLQINDGSYFIYEDSNGRRENFMYLVFFQFSAKHTILNIMISSVLVHVIKSRCADLTIHFLEIECNHWGLLSADGIVLTAVSKKTLHHVDSIIENHLKINVLNMLEKLTDDELHTFKKEVSASKALRPPNLAELSSNYWYEISNRFYNFERMDKEAELLESLKKTDLLAFFKEHLHYTSTKRRKLSVYIFPKGSSKMIDNVPSEAQEIVDTIEFKNNCILLPVEQVIEEN